MVRHDSVKKALEQPYDEPFPVLAHNDKYFTLDLNGCQDTVSLDRLKPARTDSTTTNTKDTSTSDTNTHITQSNIPQCNLTDTFPPSHITTHTRSGCAVHFPTHLNL